MSRPQTKPGPAKDRIRDARQAMYREHVLDAAEQVFAEHGYEAAKVNSVAASAGISLATLYGVFETKWDLYRGVHARRTAMLADFTRERGEVEGDVLDRMLAGIMAYIEFHMAHPSYLRMHLREGHIWSTSTTLTAPEQISAWEAGLLRMAKAFTLGIEAGVYHDDERPEMMARTMLGMHQVRLADWVDRGMTETVAEIEVKVRRQFVRAFCRPEVVATRLEKPGV
jgi:AcrR family transcriptional regulator